MSRKLNAASQLITGLGSEQTRWSADMVLIEEDKIRLVGDCLTGSAFLSYCGPFNSILRQQMIFDTWKQDLIDKELPNKEDFSLKTFLSNEVEVSKWGAEGLPADELSIQNGILTNYASRWPLCIDPQMQAVSWIKTKEGAKGAAQFDILNFNMADYIKKLEMAITFGKSVLFEGIDEELDPMIDPVLEKNIVKEAGVGYLTLADNKIEFNDNFRLFLTTKISNPNYTPEIFGKTMIINFSVTQQGLRDQLLNDIVQYERPELEEARKQLIVETSQNKSVLKGLEDTLLSELSKETDIPLVDNVPLIDTLNDAKTKSVEIGKSLEVAKETNLDIEEQRKSYKDVAWRGSILFFSIAGLSNINNMYEYSLNSYMTVFMKALQVSKKDNILQNRLRNITDKLTMLVYDFTCMGIFETHKLMYSFQMITMIMDGDNVLNKIELDFFLKGNTSLEMVEAKKPYVWMTDNGWKDIQKLNGLEDVWKGLTQNLLGAPEEWKAFFDHESPEMIDIPCGYSTTLSKFQQLLLMRVIRPDRCVNAIKNFIISYMNEYYVKSPPLSFQKIYDSSTALTPIVFILSPGADPLSDVQKLVETMGLGMNKFKFLALGQGMGDEAKSYIENGSNRGNWVML
jgi:dynein heavy chain